MRFNSFKSIKQQEEALYKHYVKTLQEDWVNSTMSKTRYASFRGIERSVMGKILLGEVKRLGRDEWDRLILTIYKENGLAGSY